MFKKFIVLFLFFFSPHILMAQYAEHVAPEFIKTIQFIGSTQQSQLPIIRLG